MKNEKGQFIKTTGSAKYRNVEYKGRRMGEHDRVMCIALGIDFIPEGLLVHHLDGNKKNNDINNLALITDTAHNRIHGHTPWNKGLKASLSKKWYDTIKIAQENRFKTFLPKFKEAFELQNSGKKLREIAVIQGTSRRQVSDRIKRYKIYIKTNN
jgi:hypothetical protein